MRTLAHHARSLGAIALVAVLAAACASTQDGGPVSPSRSASDPTASAPLSSLPLSTLRPTGPPKSPTDQSAPWIAGRITRGGSGPCYTLETDDGTQYALYSPDGITLQTGTTVRVRTEPHTIDIDCGPGQPARMLEAEPVG